MATRPACYWAILFVLPLTYANFTDVCNETYSNTQGFLCFPCSRGYTKKDDCVTNQTRAQCTKCNEGTYQPHCLSADETGECMNCTLCDVYIQNCTIYQNAVCGGSDNIKGGTSEGSGFSVLMLPLIWFFLVLVIIFAFVFCQYRYRQRRKQDVKNKRNNGRGDIKRDDRREIEYIRNSITKPLAWSSSGNIQNYRKNIDSSIDKIPKIECLFGDNDRKKDLRGSAKDLVDVHFDGSSPKRSITDSCENIVISSKNTENTVGNASTIECSFIETDKNKDFRRSATNIVDVHVNGSYPDRRRTNKRKVSEDVPKGTTNKLVRESKHIAVISPIQGEDVNKHHSLEYNGYVGQQVTQERLQTSGDSENTSKENTNNKESNNNGSSPSLDENQIIQLKEPAGSEEKDATQTNVDWFKIFKDIIPMLPIDESSWKFFAFELFHICQVRCGLPKDIHNEVKKIEHSNKNIVLAYHEVFHTWYRLMASHAELDHIEMSLQRFENGFIMQEFKLIKSNPPVRQQYPREVNSSSGTYMQNTSSLFNWLEEDHLYDAPQQYRLHHMRKQRFIQFTNVSEPLEIPKTMVNRPAIPQLKERQLRGRGPFHKLKDSNPKRNNKVWQEKRKAKTNLKTAVKMNIKEENDILKTKNIILLKKILPSRMIPVSRQEYKSFLDHTVHVIMEHNYVTKRTVLSLTYKAYAEIAETKNGDRFVLNCDNATIKLDKEQYDCLDFYVRHARTRVLAELSELRAHGDTSFLFITYDGKPELQTFHRKQSVLRKTTNASRRVDATHTCPYDGGDFSPLSASSETGDIELCKTITNKTVTNEIISTGKQNRSTVSTTQWIVLDI